MYELITLGIIAYGILIGCFSILSREHNKVTKAYYNLLQENKELNKSKDEMLKVNDALVEKYSINVNEYGMKKKNKKL